MAFRARGLDTRGDRLGPEAEQFVLPAQVQRLRGGEEVMAGRLAGKKPTLITVRLDPQSAQIDTDWRAQDVLPDEGRGQMFAVKDVTRTKDRRFVDILCEAAA
jgi:hypothetical protein